MSSLMLTDAEWISSGGSRFLIGLGGSGSSLSSSVHTFPMLLKPDLSSVRKGNHLQRVLRGKVGGMCNMRGP